MTLLDPPMEHRLGRIEERLNLIERDLAVLKARVDGLPTVWVLVGLILPLYGLIVLGFGGLFWSTLHR